VSEREGRRHHRPARDLPALEAALARIEALGVEASCRSICASSSAASASGWCTVRRGALADCDVLVFGHTHRPWVYEYPGCGS
jgi:predicted phosphodiesterase